MDAARISSKIKQPPAEEVAIQTLVMAIRERLMEYYKGTCVRRVVDSPTVKIVNLSQYASTRYSYQRQNLEQEQPAMILVDGCPIVTVRKAPARATFHTAVLFRSPQLTQVHKQLNVFMNKYLQAVRKEDSDATVTLSP